MTVQSNGVEQINKRTSFPSQSKTCVYGCGVQSVTVPWHTFCLTSHSHALFTHLPSRSHALVARLLSFGARAASNGNVAMVKVSDF